MVERFRLPAESNVYRRCCFHFSSFWKENENKSMRGLWKGLEENPSHEVAWGRVGATGADPAARLSCHPLWAHREQDPVPSGSSCPLAAPVNREVSLWSPRFLSSVRTAGLQVLEPSRSASRPAWGSPWNPA